MLDTVRRLFEQFDREGICTCHWKSNHALAEALSGEGDLDLLFQPNAREQVERVLAACGFVRAVESANAGLDDVCHYFTYDAEDDQWIHVHAYYRLKTGGAIVKNYLFPFEDVILARVEERHGIPVPNSIHEYQLFVIRKILESASIIESIMLLREYDAMCRELNWHVQRMGTMCDGRSAEDLFTEIPKEWYPELVEALSNKRAFYRRWTAGRRVARKLRKYRLNSVSSVAWRRVKEFNVICFRKMFGGGKLVPVTGGAVIAVVGHDAVGKTTSVRWISQCLGEPFVTKRIHVGKPPPTLMTVFPRIFRGLSRMFYVNERSGDERRRHAPSLITRKSTIYAVRSLIIAYDRMRLLKKARRMAGSGACVVCDRYPDSRFGGVDGPELHSAEDCGWLFRACSRMEVGIYAACPRPDFVLNLSAPIETVIQRNERRVGKERDSEQYIRMSHGIGSVPIEGTHATINFDTGEFKDATRSRLLSTTWNCIASASMECEMRS